MFSFLIVSSNWIQRGNFENGMADWNNFFICYFHLIVLNFHKLIHNQTVNTEREHEQALISIKCTSDIYLFGIYIQSWYVFENAWFGIVCFILFVVEAPQKQFTIQKRELHNIGGTHAVCPRWSVENPLVIFIFEVNKYRLNIWLQFLHVAIWNYVAAAATLFDEILLLYSFRPNEMHYTTIGHELIQISTVPLCSPENYRFYYGNEGHLRAKGGHSGLWDICVWCRWILFCDPGNPYHFYIFSHFAGKDCKMKWEIGGAMTANFTYLLLKKTAVFVSFRSAAMTHW